MLPPNQRQNTVGRVEWPRSLPGLVEGGVCLGGSESPLPPEVEDQLDRMLATTRFRHAPNQAEFLKLVVRRALRGKKTPGHVIAKELFPDSGGNDVRATADNLRKTLKKYQAQEGLEDLVIIALPDPPQDRSVKLPEGEAYTPTFSYNPKHAVGKEYKLGEYFRVQGMFNDCCLASRHYYNALKISPAHVGANLGSAEVNCRWARWYITRGLLKDREDFVEDLLLFAATTLDDMQVLVPRLWRLHAVGGFLLSVRDGVGKLAEQAFGDALSLDRLQTEDYPPYFEFLIQIGDKLEGLRLARNHRDAHVDSVGAHVSYARALCFAREYADAEAVLENALSLGKGDVGLQYLLAVLRTAQRKHFKAIGHLLLLKSLADPLTIAVAERQVAQIRSTQVAKLAKRMPLLQTAWNHTPLSRIGDRTTAKPFSLI